MINMVCAIIFITFVFLYVFCYQADLLALAQHAWSGGKTTFNPLVGAPIFCAILFLIFCGVKNIFPLPPYIRTVSYFPSLLFLGVLTSIEPEKNTEITVGNWSWISIVLIVVYCILVKPFTELTSLHIRLRSNSLLSRVAWTNYAILALLFLMTIAIGNNDRKLHRDLHAENLINSRSYSSATEYERKSQQTDSTLTMFRALSLSKQNLLGEQLFAYALPPLSATSSRLPSSVLFPHSDGSCKFTFADEGILWRQMGAMPREEITDAKAFLLSLRRHHVARPAVNDYLLCAYLLDRDLKGFVTELSHQIDTVRIVPSIKGKELDTLLQRKADVLNAGLKKLPRHYREALVLYNHTHSNRIITYSDEVLDADYRDFCAMEQKSSAERQALLQTTYRGTYWLYFLNS